MDIRVLTSWCLCSSSPPSFALKKRVSGGKKLNGNPHIDHEKGKRWEVPSSIPLMS